MSEANSAKASTRATERYAKFTDNAKKGLWTNNPALVQLLGLCPLLAISNTCVNALGLGLATLCVLVLSNTVVSMIRHKVDTAIRLPCFVLVIAAATTCIELLMQAYTFELYEILGIFIPLIVTNCTVLGRADTFASKHPIHLSAWDGAMTGLGFLWVLLVIGMIREILGQGTLFAQMDLLIPWWPEKLHWQLPESFRPFLLAALPPGAFITVGFLVALKKATDRWIAAKLKARSGPVTVGANRVRVTGHIN